MTIHWINLSAAVNGTGTELSPYNSFASLPALSAGDVVKVEGAGTMSAEYAFAASGSSGNPIVFEAKDPSNKPVIRPASATTHGIRITSRNWITLRNLRMEGTDAYMAGSISCRGFFVNGACSNIVFDGLEGTKLSVGIRLDGGFSTSNITITNCEMFGNGSSGLEWFSGSGTYTWTGIHVEGGRYENNGLKGAASGQGVVMFIQPGHTTSTLENVEIINIRATKNNRDGISLRDGAVALGGSTPPRQIHGVRINHNTVLDNGGSGITLLGAQASGSILVEILSNYCDGNGSTTTNGNIWTAGNLEPEIAYNWCRKAYSNGTVVGDGQGIFDDHWNDGAWVHHNLIQDNIFQDFNPEWSAYGIGIYRCLNSLHEENIIDGCRYGFVIGEIASTPGPTMTGIVVKHNTITNTTKAGFSLWFYLPASCLTLSNNLIDGCLNAMEAQSVGAGTQTFVDNIAFNSTLQTTPSITGGVTFEAGSAQLRADYAPKNAAAYGAGTFLGGTDFHGLAHPNPPTVGAVEYQEPLATASMPGFLYDNRLNDGTPVASSTAADCDVLNLLDLRPYSFWRPTTLPATITVDCGVARRADFAAIYRHDLCSCHCAIEIRASSDNFSSSDVLLIVRRPFDDEPMILPFESALYRYWRIRITGYETPTLAIALIGQALRLPRRLQQGFDPTRRDAKSTTNISGAGYPLGRVITFEEWKQNVSVRNIDADWIRSTWIPAWKEHLRSEPFLFAWDSSDHPTEIQLALADGDYRTPTGAGSLVSLQLDITGVAA